MVDFLVDTNGNFIVDSNGGFLVNTSVVPSFLPTDISGLNLWLDASQGVYKDAAMTLPCSDGDSVYTFKDMSGNNNHAIQGVGSVQPVKYDNILNGKSVIRFNGIGDYLLSTLSANLSQPYVVIMVYKVLSYVNAYNMVWSANDGAGSRMLNWHTNLASARFWKNSTEIPFQAHITNFGYDLLEVNGGNTKSYIDKYYYAGTIFDNGTANYFSIGREYPLNLDAANIDVAEVIIYNRTLDDSLLNLLNTYIGNKYALFKMSAIPFMTSNNTPSGVASASSVWSGDVARQAYRCMTLTTDNVYGWYSNGGGPEWLKYEFDSSEIITSYSIDCTNNSGAWALKDWTFEGSNDDTNWTVLDTRTNILTSTWASRQYFAFTNTTTYKYYRFNISVGNNAVLINIGKLELYKN